MWERFGFFNSNVAMNNNPLRVIDFTGMNGDSTSNSNSRKEENKSAKTSQDNEKKAKVKDLNASEKLLTYLKKSEALRLKLYNCPANFATIGYGHLVTKSKVGEGTDEQKKIQEEYSNGIDEKKADEIFKNNVENVGKKGVENTITVELTQSQFDALVSLALNIGGSNLKGSSLVENSNESKVDSTTITNGFGAWNKAGTPKTEQPGLTKRRKEEAQIFLNGVFP